MFQQSCTGKSFLCCVIMKEQVQKTAIVFNILEDLFLEHVNGVVSGHESELYVLS